MKKNSIYISIFFVGLGLFSFIFLLWRNGIIHSGTPYQMHLAYITDFTDDRKLIGASHNVVVGTVLEKKGTIRFPGDMPGEIFSFQVKENIKGKESGIINIIKEGGCLDGKCYVLSGDTGNETNSYDMGLEIGHEYTLALRKDSNFGYIVISHPNAQIRMNGSPKNKINSLYSAYSKEILFDGDIASGNTENSFLSLSKGEKDKIEQRGNDRAEEGKK